MARQKGDKIENKFIKGLITEKSPIDFPKDSCSEAWNCVFDEKGRVYRRKGVMIEQGGVPISYTTTENEVFTEFLWTGAGGVGTKTYYLQQIGASIFVYDVSSSEVISTSTLKLTIDLEDFLPLGSPYLPGEYQCQYSKGNGTCIVTSPACESFFIEYDFETDTLSTVQITLEQRDFEGLEDGVAEYTRQTATVAGVTSSNPQFLYNLLNQGWSQSDALSQWDTARTDLPSHRDIPSLFRSSATDAFDNALVTSKSAGTAPAPKGHFIIEPNTPVRETVAALEGYTLSLEESTQLAVTTDFTVSLWTDLNTNTSALTDGTTVQTATNCTRNSAAIVNTGAIQRTAFIINLNTTRKISQVILYGPSDGNFLTGPDNGGFVIRGGTGAPPPLGVVADLTVYGDVAFTGIGFSITSFGSGQVLTATNTLGPDLGFDWLAVFFNATSLTPPDNCFLRIAEVKVFASPGTYQRAGTNTFYQGRAWYAGFEAEQLSSSIYFSQIIENKNQYGKCYQRQDPTNEFFNELLASDGGVIRILEIEKIVKLVSTQSSVIALATNGVWEIKGEPYFTASNYSIRKMSNIGCFSPLSVTDYRGIPVWWGEDGIYTIQFDPQFQTFQVVNMTEDTIKDFINEIPSYNRSYVKGAYDVLEDTLYWIYNSDTSLASGDEYKYNKVLALNRRSIAFYPWDVDDTTKVIRGFFYHNPVSRQVDNNMKYVYTDLSDTEFCHAEFRDPNYEDWETVDFESYFITGYDINQTGLKHGSPNYVQVFVDLLDYDPLATAPGALIQGVYDFTTSDSLQRWSTPQQVYPASLGSRKSSFRRLKIRGKGKSIQFKIKSETGKPFSIFGWSSAQTGNADV